MEPLLSAWNQSRKLLERGSRRTCHDGVLTKVSGLGEVLEGDAKIRPESGAAASPREPSSSAPSRMVKQPAALRHSWGLHPGQSHSQKISTSWQVCAHMVPIWRSHSMESDSGWSSGVLQIVVQEWAHSPSADVLGLRRQLNTSSMLVSARLYDSKRVAITNQCQHSRWCSLHHPQQHCQGATSGFVWCQIITCETCPVHDMSHRSHIHDVGAGSTIANDQSRWKFHLSHLCLVVASTSRCKHRWWWVWSSHLGWSWGWQLRARRHPLYPHWLGTKKNSTQQWPMVGC